MYGIDKAMLKLGLLSKRYKEKCIIVHINSNMGTLLINMELQELDTHHRANM